MRIGFTFGKYYPFHKGHQALMDFALKQLDVLYVVVCASERELIPAAVRSNWIRHTFPDEERLQVIALEYEEAELPNTSVSSRSVSQIWAEKFKDLLPPVDVVITSEPYGDFVAEYMNIKHLPFDPERGNTPISASEIRESLHEHWDFLPDAVKRFFQQKVVFLGTESTGKSSISTALAERFPATLVPEVGREMVSDSNDFSQALLEEVAVAHARAIAEGCVLLKPLVLIDTDVHITQSYVHSRFGTYLDLPPEVYEQNRADLYIYLAPDLPYEQDGTRLDEEERNKLDASHRQTLADFGIEYVAIRGGWEERLELSEKFICEVLCYLGAF